MSARTTSQLQGPVRIQPAQGHPLDMSVFRGQQWRPTGTAGCSSVFGVTWQSYSGRSFWAALHDFDPLTQSYLIGMCAQQDRGRGPRGW